LARSIPIDAGTCRGLPAVLPALVPVWSIAGALTGTGLPAPLPAARPVI